MRVIYFFYERCGPWPHPQSLPDPSADPMIRLSISCQPLQPLLPTMPSRGTCPTRLLRMLLIPVAAVVIARLEPENQEDTDMIIIKSVDFACFNYHCGGLETSVN